MVQTKTCHLGKVSYAIILLGWRYTSYIPLVFYCVSDEKKNNLSLSRLHVNPVNFFISVHLDGKEFVLIPYKKNAHILVDFQAVK